MKVIGDSLRGIMGNIEKACRKGEAVMDFPTGFISLDKALFGFEKGEVVIVGSRPGMGKTSFLLTMAYNLSLFHHIPVAYISIESSPQQIMYRLLAIDIGLPVTSMKTGQLNQKDWERLIENKLVDLPIYLSDPLESIHIQDVIPTIRKAVAEHSAKFIFIDYLQLLRIEHRRGHNREEEVAASMRMLKNLAVESGVVMVIGSQLSRAVETRGGYRRPMLSDLRESGAIEQDADKVIFLYRPEYYGITEDESGNKTVGLTEVIIAKNRMGPLATIPLLFVGDIGKFVEYEGNVADFTKMLQDIEKQISDDEDDEDDDEDDEDSGMPF